MVFDCGIGIIIIVVIIIATTFPTEKQDFSWGILEVHWGGGELKGRGGGGGGGGGAGFFNWVGVPPSK